MKRNLGLLLSCQGLFLFCLSVDCLASPSGICLMVEKAQRAGLLETGSRVLRSNLEAIFQPSNTDGRSNFALTAQQLALLNAQLRKIIHYDKKQQWRNFTFSLKDFFLGNLNSFANTSKERAEGLKRVLSSSVKRSDEEQEVLQKFFKIFLNAKSSRPVPEVSFFFEHGLRSENSLGELVYAFFNAASGAHFSDSSDQRGFQLTVLGLKVTKLVFKPNPLDSRNPASSIARTIGEFEGILELKLGAPYDVQKKECFQLVIGNKIGQRLLPLHLLVKRKDGPLDARIPMERSLFEKVSEIEMLLSYYDDGNRKATKLPLATMVLTKLVEGFVDYLKFQCCYPIHPLGPVELSDISHFKDAPERNQVADLASLIDRAQHSFLVLSRQWLTHPVRSDGVKSGLEKAERDLEGLFQELQKVQETMRVIAFPLQGLANQLLEASIGVSGLSYRASLVFQAKAAIDAARVVFKTLCYREKLWRYSKDVDPTKHGRLRLILQDALEVLKTRFEHEANVLIGTGIDLTLADYYRRVGYLFSCDFLQDFTTRLCLEDSPATAYLLEWYRNVMNAYLQGSFGYLQMLHSLHSKFVVDRIFSIDFWLPQGHDSEIEKICKVGPFQVNLGARFETIQATESSDFVNENGFMRELLDVLYSNGQEQVAALERSFLDSLFSRNIVAKKIRKATKHLAKLQSDPGSANNQIEEAVAQSLNQQKEAELGVAMNPSLKSFDLSDFTDEAILHFSGGNLLLHQNKESLVLAINRIIEKYTLNAGPFLLQGGSFHPVQFNQNDQKKGVAGFLETLVPCFSIEVSAVSELGIELLPVTDSENNEFDDSGKLSIDVSVSLKALNILAQVYFRLGWPQEFVLNFVVHPMKFHAEIEDIRLCDFVELAKLKNEAHKKRTNQGEFYEESYMDKHLRSVFAANDYLFKRVLKNYIVFDSQKYYLSELRTGRSSIRIPESSRRLDMNALQGLWYFYKLKQIF